MDNKLFSDDALDNQEQLDWKEIVKKDTTERMSRLGYARMVGDQMVVDVIINEHLVTLKLNLDYSNT